MRVYLEDETTTTSAKMRALSTVFHRNMMSQMHKRKREIRRFRQITCLVEEEPRYFSYKTGVRCGTPNLHCCNPTMVAAEGGQRNWVVVAVGLNRSLGHLGHRELLVEQPEPERSIVRRPYSSDNHL